MVKPSERLGNYEVATSADGSALMLGSGAGGVTYRGRHIHLGTEVAIKVLIRRKNLLQKDRDAFLSEARSAASLSHPRIARILDFGESDQKHPYYVMELCEGGSLEDLRRKSGPPEASTCTQWLLESASALAHAHQKGILHRDIKPSNLLVAKDGEHASIKLIDFGLADHADQGDASEQVIGTPHFAAPEQLAGHAQAASDVFSLGATFLWLLTGKHLSQGDVKAVIAERLESPGYLHLLASLPPPWQNVLGRMLEVDANRRSRDGNEVLELIRAAFPDHTGQPVAWDASAAFQSPAAASPAPSQWRELPGTAWTDHWSTLGTPVPNDYGVSVRARRTDEQEPYDAILFENPPAEIVHLLIVQGDLVARHAAHLGLGHLILERGDQWCSVAWPAMGPEDALSWVRKGQTASTAEILAAMDPIAFALDGMKSGGFEHLEIHPSMMIVAYDGATPLSPLAFSLAVPLPVSDSAEQAADSAGTMRGAMGAGLPARFASCIYQLLSGRTPAPAAFVNVRAYQAIPKLTERSNRFLASAIAGASAGATCQDVIRGLAHEERIPGASLSGGSSLGLGAPLSSRRSSSPTSSVSMGFPPSPAASQRTETLPNNPPPAPAPARIDAPAPPPAVPVAATPSDRKRLNPALPAAAVLLAAGAGAWFFFQKYTPPSPAPPTSEAKTSAQPAPESPSTSPTPPSLEATEPPINQPAATSESLIKVPSEVATLAEAIKLCDPGGTIEIAGGTYAEPILLTKSLTLVSVPAAVFEDPGSGSSLIMARGPIQVTLRNLQLKNSQAEASAPPEDSPALVLITDGASVTFDGCVIEGSVGNGISLAGKASASLSNCRVRKNRGYGINASSGSTVNISLSEIEESGRSGIALSNVGSSANLGNGSTISRNSRNGIEVANGAKLTCAGTRIQANQKVGLIIEGGGSHASLSAACIIASNLKYGIGILNSGNLDLTDSSVEDNNENGIYLESGGQARILNSTFKSNGTIGLYLVEGSSSSATIDKSVFDGHSDAGVAIVGGHGSISECRFASNKMAVFFGPAATGSAIGNSVIPGPVENMIILENSGEVDLRDNVVGSQAAPQESTGP